jgi:glycolate oxidase FAD binding subunit
VPDSSSTLLIASSSQADLLQLANKVLSSEFQPASVILTHRLTESTGLCSQDDALLIRFIDNEAAVGAQVKRVNTSTDKNHQVDLLSQMQADTLWAAVADLEKSQTRLKISVPLSAVRALYEETTRSISDCIAAVDIGTGIIRLAFDSSDASVLDLVNRFRASSAAVNGTVVIEKASLEVRRAIDSWGDIGSTATLMKSIKAAFDPQSLLNPSKFVLGL